MQDLECCSYVQYINLARSFFELPQQLYLPKNIDSSEVLLYFIHLNLETKKHLRRVSELRNKPEATVLTFTALSPGWNESSLRSPKIHS